MTEYLKLKNLYEKKLKGGMKKNHLRKSFKEEIENPEFKSSDLSHLFFDYYKKNDLDCASLYFKIFPEVLNKKGFYLNIMNNVELYLNEKFLSFLIDFEILKDQNKINLWVTNLNKSPEFIYSYKEKLSFEDLSFIYASFIKKGFQIENFYLFELFNNHYYLSFNKDNTIENVDLIIESKKNEYTSLIKKEKYNFKKYNTDNEYIPFWLCLFNVLQIDVNERQDYEVSEIIKKYCTNEIIKESFLNLKLESPMRISTRTASFLKGLNIETKEIEKLGFLGYGVMNQITDFDYFYKNNFDLNAFPENHFFKKIDSHLLLKDIFEYLLVNNNQMVNFELIIKKETTRKPAENLEEYLNGKINTLSHSLIHWKETSLPISEWVDMNNKLLLILVDKMRLIDRIQINEKLTKKYNKRL